MTRRELRRENDELRDALSLRGLRTIEEWEALGAAIRDPLAARAFIAEYGDKGRALIRLGFPRLIGCRLIKFTCTTFTRPVRPMKVAQKIQGLSSR
jgi:hypothetical protein